MLNLLQHLKDGYALVYLLINSWQISMWGAEINSA